MESRSLHYPEAALRTAIRAAIRAAIRVRSRRRGDGLFRGSRVYQATAGTFSE
jgi:hypothetical protein